jgi:predicted amidohydrolase YtcJ
VHLHTIGDRAVRDALDAIGAARAANGVRDARHHLAHVQLIHPDDVPRFRELDVVANCQTYWAQTEPQMEELTLPFLGKARGERQYPFADLLRAGARLAMGSDWSVTTADPLQQMEVAVTRVDPAHRDTAPFLPEQRLTLAEALRGFTSGSAFVNHDDAESGTLSPGRRADLAVLDLDPFAEHAPPVGDARVDFTIAAGRMVHERR